VTPEAIEDLAALQRRILAAGAAVLRPGGSVVYSVCTISRMEGEGMIDRFLERERDFEAAGAHLQLLPHRDGTDGFFIAHLRRRGRGQGAEGTGGAAKSSTVP
jgi:16S rRNA (cytosine967-C5)-methyltransferase